MSPPSLCYVISRSAASLLAPCLSRSPSLSLSLSLPHSIVFLLSFSDLTRSRSRGPASPSPSLSLPTSLSLSASLARVISFGSRLLIAPAGAPIEKTWRPTKSLKQMLLEVNAYFWDPVLRGGVTERANQHVNRKQNTNHQDQRNVDCYNRRHQKRLMA